MGTPAEDLERLGQSDGPNKPGFKVVKTEAPEGAIFNPAAAVLAGDANVDYTALVQLSAAKPVDMLKDVMVEMGSWPESTDDATKLEEKIDQAYQYYVAELLGGDPSLEYPIREKSYELFDHTEEFDDAPIFTVLDELRSQVRERETYARNAHHAVEAVYVARVILLDLART